MSEKKPDRFESLVVRAYTRNHVNDGLCGETWIKETAHVLRAEHRAALRTELAAARRDALGEGGRITANLLLTWAVLLGISLTCWGLLAWWLLS